MSVFDKVANDILKGLNENFINSAADAVQHTWAKTIAHPGLGEEDEEFAVVDHSLTSDGIIEEYYVQHKGQLVAVPADEARVVVIKEHNPGSDEEHGVKKKKKNAKKLSKKKKKSKNSPPDDDEDGVPNWADKHPGEDDHKK